MDLLSRLILFMCLFLHLGFTLTLPRPLAIGVWSNNSLGAFNQDSRCPQKASIVELHERYTIGSKSYAVNLFFHEVSSFSQRVSLREMRAIAACYFEFATYIEETPIGSGVPARLFLCSKEIYNEHAEQGRLVFRFQLWPEPRGARMSKDLGLDLIYFLGHQFSTCSRQLSSFWAAGRYRISTNVGVIGEVDWNLRY